MSAPSIDSTRPYYTVNTARQFLLENDANYRQLVADANAHKEVFRKNIEEAQRDAEDLQIALKRLNPRPPTKFDFIVHCCALLILLGIWIVAVKSGKLRFR